MSQFSSIQILIIKNNFNDIIKYISDILLNIFCYFIKDQFSSDYPDLIDNNNDLKLLFNDRSYKLSNKESKSEIVDSINENLKKIIPSMKNKFRDTFENTRIKPFSSAILQILKRIDYISLNRVSNIIFNTLLFGELNKKYINLSLNDNNTNDSEPFLPSNNNRYKYTLILKIDETLIHYYPKKDNNGMILIRPFCLYFLNELNNYYEIVTFNYGSKDYTDKILSIIDMNNIIKYRLNDKHFTDYQFYKLKDLQKLGRDISKVIIIDNNKYRFNCLPDNGIPIKTWISDIYDTELYFLLKILKDIVEFKVKDVRTIIKRINYELKNNMSLQDIDVKSKLNHF